MFFSRGVALLAATAALAMMATAPCSAEDWQEMEVDMASAAVLYRALARAENYAADVKTYACAGRVHHIEYLGYPDREYVIQADTCLLDKPKTTGFCFNCRGVNMEFHVRVNDGKSAVTSISPVQ